MFLRKVLISIDLQIEGKKKLTVKFIVRRNKITIMKTHINLTCRAQDLQFKLMLTKSNLKFKVVTAS